MEIIEKIKTNKSDDNLTEIQKICLHKLQSTPLPNPKSEPWRLSNKSKLSTFLDYSVNKKDSNFDIPYPKNSQSTIRLIIGENCQIKLIENNYSIQQLSEDELQKYIKEQISFFKQNENWSDLLNLSLSCKKNILGQLAIVLHAHLPYVRKNEKNSLEEDWLFQAILECYIPLLQAIESSKKENPLNTKLTISLSPTLLSLLNNKKIQETFPNWIKTRNDFLNELPLEEKNASAFLMKNLNDKYLYWQNCSGNLIEKFRLLNNSGNLDILTCAATHGYLPILRENPETVKGQINTAIRNHENIFGTKPFGIWLPECAYYENLDEILSNSGIRYAILDGHGILNATPRPRYGVYAPICSKKGVAFFGRDSESTLPVWSAKDGFPGDKVYREFHKDLGWELPISKLQKKVSQLKDL